VPGDDLVIIADQHRVGEAEPLDAVGDLLDLLLGMGAGIAAVDTVIIVKGFLIG
jgi:hypothetical protein